MGKWNLCVVPSCIFRTQLFFLFCFVFLLRQTKFKISSSQRRSVKRKTLLQYTSLWGVYSAPYSGFWLQESQFFVHRVYILSCHLVVASRLLSSTRPLLDVRRRRSVGGKISFFSSFMRLGWVVKKQNKKASAYIGFVPLPMEFQRRRSANHFLLLQLLPAKDAKFSLLNHFEGEKAQNNKGRRNIYTTGAGAYIAVRVRHKIYDIFFCCFVSQTSLDPEQLAEGGQEQMYFYILSHVFLY